MYPVRLTLLSSTKRSHLQRLLYIQFAKASLELLLFVAAISSIILLGARFVLQDYFNNLAANLAAIGSQQTIRNNEIKTINLQLTYIDNVQKLYTLWTPILHQLTSALPDGVYLNTIQADASGKIYNLSGLASDRSDLLQLESKLELLPIIADVIIPVSALTEKANINFSINIKGK